MTTRPTGLGADDPLAQGFRAALDGLVWDTDPLLRRAAPVTQETADALCQHIVAGGWLAIGEAGSDPDLDVLTAVQCAWHLGNRLVPVPVPMVELWLGRLVERDLGSEHIGALGVTDAVDGPMETATSISAGPLLWPLLAPVLTVAGDGRVMRADPEGTLVEAIAPLDPTGPAAIVSGNRRAWHCSGRLGAGPAQHVRRMGLLLGAGEMLGIADELFEHTLTHLRERHQFGVPIGSFQALKHRAVDLQAELLAAKALLRSAAEVGADGGDAALAMARMAFATAGESALAVGSEAVQLHGGYGFTWEAGLHLGFRRASLRAAAAGGPGRCWHLAGEWLSTCGTVPWPSPDRSR
jgi:hypothetical protein